MGTGDGSLFVGPHDGKELPNPIGGRMVVKVRDEDTAGAYSIHDNSIPPDSPGPRPHIHRHHEEAFYVLEGELTVRVGPQKLYKLLLALATVVALGYRLWHHDCGVGSSL
jgi:quercetin dioxygenase-like cupin family protein